MKKILVVDDDKKYLNNLRDVLNEAGYKVDTADDAIEGIELLSENTYDLVMSDLKMEVMDGNRFLAFVQRTHPEVASILLTGEPDPTSHIAALEGNVNQYLDKSVRMEVLLKYVEKIIEGSNKKLKASREYHSHAEDLHMDMRGRTVTIRGEKIDLTAREFGILAFLLENKGNALSRQDIIEELWDDRFEDVDTRVVDVHIKLIRKKTKVSSIITIRGYGYKWDE